jgi:hypothetical protein
MHEGAIEEALVALDAMPSLPPDAQAECDRRRSLLREAWERGDADLLRAARWSGDVPIGWKFNMGERGFGGTVWMRDEWNTMVDELRYLIRQRTRHRHSGPGPLMA